MAVWNRRYGTHRQNIPAHVDSNSYRWRGYFGIQVLLQELTDMNYEFENYIQKAIEMVEGFDLPQDQFARAVNEQAQLMAGITLDIQETRLTIQLHTTLRF